MGKFIANPVSVDAHQVVEIAVFDDHMHARKNVTFKLDDGTAFTPTPEQLARIEPVIGDYVVTQDDGYTYLVPRAVFERKYKPKDSRVAFVESREIAGFLGAVQDRILNADEPVEAAVVVYGTYGGKFFVESTESGITALGLLDIGNRTMMDAIIKPLNG